MQNPNPSRDPKSPGTEPLSAGRRADDSLRNSDGDGAPVLLQTSISPRHKLEAWLAEMVRMNASDLILRAGGRPSCRIDGRIHFLPGRVPPPGALLDVLLGVCGEDKMNTWRTRGSVDTALQLDGLGRFRLNAYKQMGEPAVVLRRISQEAPQLTSLGLPTQQLERIALKKRGIVLVTGIAGSGKSTALAGLIQYMNSHAERHIITLEDPVELLFTEDRCVISQREVGTDTIDFAEGLRHALRQSPDVILIGEMRDAETVAAALDATETGHLVFSTLHTVNAPQTVDRILSFFPAPRHQQIRQRLAENIAAVLSLRLLPRKSGRGMVPACELLLSTPRVRDLLYEGQVSDLSRVVEAGGEEGLISFNHSLRMLVQQDVIELETALAASDRPEELLLALRGFSKGRGNPQSTNGPAGRLRLAGGGE
ncbi:MAG: PilT/PilU family type 4a pilus ATPase [Planctomycetes bacterium]|nr:PilT/PilU family type 4a pilus ATPase [Planctomycetota bacterium]